MARPVLDYPRPMPTRELRYRLRPRARSPTPLPSLLMTTPKKPTPDRAPSAALPPATEPVLPELTDAELDALSAITPDDIASAKAAWRRGVKGTGLDNLLDATDDETGGR